MTTVVCSAMCSVSATAEKGVRFVADYVDGSAAMVEIFGPRGRDAASG